MSKLKKVFIMLFLGVVMIFGIVGCDAGTQKEYQSKKDDTQSKVEESDNGLSGNSSEEEELMGKFYTLQEAYDKGFLTREDLMSIAYYHNGGRTHNEEIMSENYQPTPKTPEILSEKTQLKIKSVAAEEYREEYDIKDAEAAGFTITQYCGTYGDCIAVMMRDNYTGYWDWEVTNCVAGIKLYYNNSNQMKIWRETK